MIPSGSSGVVDVEDTPVLVDGQNGRPHGTPFVVDDGPASGKVDFHYLLDRSRGSVRDARQDCDHRDKSAHVADALPHDTTTPSPPPTIPSTPNPLNTSFTSTSSSPHT